MKSSQIVTELLEEAAWVRALIAESSVHRPRRGKIWVASFTGVEGQQWKSTGTTDQALARARAREFEAAARGQRASSGRVAHPRQPGIRQVAGAFGNGLTQREVGLLLGLSERAVRAIEKRALRKLARHPDLRNLWRQFLSGALTEERHRLSAPEVNAMVRLTRSHAERAALRKALERVQTQSGGTGPGTKMPPDR